MKKLYFFLFMSLIFNSIFTTNQKPQLRDFASKVYSQFGEEGIIKKIFEIIGTRSKICIEFGAWDGFYLSNTALLWSTQNWKGILIESDPNSYANLLKKLNNRFDCLCINAHIGNQPENNLEEILKQNGFNFTDIDLLSVDIDGNDYFVIQSIKNLKPRLIICEYNPTMPAHLDIYQPYDSYLGCSVGALNRIASTKGYKLIALTDANAFFVTEEDYSKFDDYETSLEKIRIDCYIKYFFTSFDGGYIVAAQSNIDPFNIRYKYDKAVCFNAPARIVDLP